MKKQNINYWKSIVAIKRYADMEYKLTDIESVFILEAICILSKPTKEIKVLDLGCGGGRTTIPLYNMGLDIIGLDISEPLIKKLSLKVKDIAIIGDAQNLPFANKTFDIVLFSHNGIDYIYPIENRTKAFEEINRVLKSNGLFIFSSHIFNIPFNFHTLKQWILNLNKIPKLVSKGYCYYKEYVDNQNFLTYCISCINLNRVIKDLDKYGFTIYKYTNYNVIENSLVKTFLKALTSWETYYLAIKKK